MKFTSSRQREWINKFAQYLVGCIAVSLVIRFTACKLFDQPVGRSIFPSAELRSKLPSAEAVNLPSAEVVAEQRSILPSAEHQLKAPDTPSSDQRVEPGCKSKIDVERIFPDKKKLWIQIGTYFNPLTPPSDVGMIAFEAELSTVAKVAESRRENMYIIPAAVSDHAGVAVFRAGVNAGQTSSLNVRRSFRFSLLFSILWLHSMCICVP